MRKLLIPLIILGISINLYSFKQSSRKGLCPICFNKVYYTGINFAPTNLSWNYTYRGFLPWKMTRINNMYLGVFGCMHCSFSMMGSDYYFLMDGKIKFRENGRRYYGTRSGIPAKTSIILDIKNRPEKFLGEGNELVIHDKEKDIPLYVQFENIKTLYEYLFTLTEFKELYSGERIYFWTEFYASLSDEYNRNGLTQKSDIARRKGIGYGLKFLERKIDIRELQTATYSEINFQNVEAIARYKEAAALTATMAGKSQMYEEAIDAYWKCLKSGISLEAIYSDNSERRIGQYNYCFDTLMINDLEYISFKGDTSVWEGVQIDFLILAYLLKSFSGQDLSFWFFTILLGLTIVSLIHFTFKNKIASFFIAIVFTLAGIHFIDMYHTLSYSAAISSAMVFIIMFALYNRIMNLYGSGSQKSIGDDLLFRRIRYSVIALPLLHNFHSGLLYLQERPDEFWDRMLPIVAVILILNLLVHLYRVKVIKEKPGLFPYLSILLSIPVFKYIYQDTANFIDIGTTYRFLTQAFLVNSIQIAVLSVITVFIVAALLKKYRSYYAKALVYTLSFIVPVFSVLYIWYFDLESGERAPRVIFYAEYDDYRPVVMNCLLLIFSGFMVWLSVIGFKNFVNRYTKGFIKRGINDVFDKTDTKIFLINPLLTALFVYIFKYNMFKLLSTVIIGDSFCFSIELLSNIIYHPWRFG